MFCLRTCNCMACLLGAHRGQKKVPYLSLLVILSHHVGAGHHIWVLCNSISPTPMFIPLAEWIHRIQYILE